MPSKSLTVSWSLPFSLLVVAFAFSYTVFRALPDPSVSKLGVIGLGGQVAAGLGAWLAVLSAQDCADLGSIRAWTLYVLAGTAVVLIGPTTAAGVVLGNRTVWTGRTFGIIVLSLVLAAAAWVALLRAVLCAVV